MLPTTAKALGRLLHYLGGRGGGGSLLSQSIVAAEERVAREATRRERRNAAHRSAFEKSDEAPAWVCADPTLADAWPRDQSLTPRRWPRGAYASSTGSLRRLARSDLSARPPLPLAAGAKGKAPCPRALPPLEGTTLTTTATAVEVPPGRPTERTRSPSSTS